MLINERMTTTRMMFRVFIPNDPCPPYLRQTVTVIQNPSRTYCNTVYLLVACEAVSL